MIIKIRLFILLTVSLLTLSCSPTDDDGAVHFDDLVGLWNSSENVDGKIDTIYTRVTSDGAIIEYDFDGDDVDQGLNCYQVVTGSVKALSGNRFMVDVDMHESKQFEVELELLDAGQALKIYFMDKETPTKTLKSQIWTRESDASILDKEPSCKAL
jgi:hypothetical protein